MKSREVITLAVRNLMAAHEVGYREIAECLGLSNAAYVKTKIELSRWSWEDLDRLADFFEVEPYQIVQGYDLKMVLTPREEPEEGENE